LEVITEITALEENVGCMLYMNLHIVEVERNGRKHHENFRQLWEEDGKTDMYLVYKLNALLNRGTSVLDRL